MGSDDLSPLNVSFTFNGAPTSNWSWLGNSKPTNYLQFFNANSGFLSSGDILGVTFLSAFAPGAAQFAIGINSSTNTTSNQVTGVTAPTAGSIPEPASLGMLALGALGIAIPAAALGRATNQ